MDHPTRPDSALEQRQLPATYTSTSRHRQLRTAYLLVTIGLIAAFPVSPTWAQLTIRLAASLATIPALLSGTRRISPDRRAVWILLLVALTLINLANIVRLFPGHQTAEQLIDAGASLVSLVAAVQLIHQQERANLGSIIDTSIVALAVGGLLWDLFLAPNVVASSRTHTDKLAMFIVVFALSGILGALVQMIIQRRIPALRPLVVALALGLTGNTLPAVTTNPQLTTTAQMMIIGGYTAVGLFGLDPTAEQLATPAPAHPDRLSRGRIIFLGTAVAATPIVIALQQVAGGARHSVLLLVSSATITTLVMLRIAQLSAQRDQAEKALRHDASHDPLTGLPNRKEFTNQVDRELTRHNHSAIMFCDLDQFKAINDRFGHAHGDQVLVEVANRLRDSVRTADLVSRLGGDEFVVLLRNTTPTEVQAIHRRITETVTRPILIADHPTTIGITTGTAFASNHADADELIEHADHAMYLAKTNDQPRHNH
jgi:diguanylate cyclase